MRFWMGLVLGCWAASVLAADVFEMPKVYPRHRQLQQMFIQSVRAGRTAEMEQICREAVEILPEDPTWRYNLACALAYKADKAEALAVLERAVELGFRDRKAIEADTDLKPLAEMPAFKELLAKADALKNQPVAGVVRASPLLVEAGRPAEVHASNTVWNLNDGYFNVYFQVRKPAAKAAELAEAYCGPAAEQMRPWLAAGKAAGSAGDLYVNRDDGHSLLAVTNFPGLTPVVYCAEVRENNLAVAQPNMLFNYPVIGNSSMSMVNGPYWRSLPRAIMTDPFQPTVAFQMYVNNQCWFYPAHKDYGSESGDLLTANTPYYVVSLGSSYTDRPFMEAFAAASAALQPPTKQVLVATKQLAPTLQMLFRMSQRAVKKPEDYLTCAAHPAVFDPARLDVEAMVKRAHELPAAAIPPTVMLRTHRDAQPVPGVDFFDMRPEGLFDTPFAIARVVRGVARERSMTVEASATARNKRYTYIWRVRQGDTKRIEIKPLNAEASRVEIKVAYHGRFRVTDAEGLPTGLASGRVDIGCFVKEGEYYSAPSFVSFYYLPNEERVYRADGKVLSVDYANTGHHYADPALTVAKNWKDLYEYDDAGRLTGWFRTRGGGSPERYTWKGHKVLEADSEGRPARACAVQYLPRQAGTPGMLPSLAVAETAQIFRYTYKDAADKVGTVKEE